MNRENPGRGGRGSARDPGSSLADRLDEGAGLILDGATGTELERRGHAAGLPLWSTHALLDAPEAVAEIHGDYARAGADIITANTFRTQRRALERAAGGGLGERDAELTARAVELARRGAGAGSILIAGSAPPLEDCYRPEHVPGPGALEREHRRHMENLAVAGVDLALVETMNTSREAVAACKAARACDLPLLVSFVCGDDARLLSGENLEAAIVSVSNSEPAAILVNCLSPLAALDCLPALQASGLRFGVYANLGQPTAAGTFARNDACTPGAFSDHASAWRDAGARIVGGCCGTTPEHIRAIAERALPR